MTVTTAATRTEGDHPHESPESTPTPSTVHEIRTTRFGTVRADADHTFTLPDGIPGFRSIGGLVVIPVDDDALFVWLQAVDDGSLAFLAVNPWPFFPDYEVELADADRDALGIADGGDALVFCLVRAERDERRFSVNLLAPLVFGVDRRLGRQITLEADLPLAAPLATPTGAPAPDPQPRLARRPTADAATAADDSIDVNITPLRETT